MSIFTPTRRRLHAHAAAWLLGACIAYAHAAVDVESLIVLNPQIAALDVKLNVDYKEALAAVADAKALRAEQRAWIATVRNKCADTTCLLSAYRQRNKELQERISRRNCPVKESDLLASWQRVKGGFFEEFALEREGEARSFSSWLHHRPEMSGTWALANCILTISNPSHAAFEFEYKITGYGNGVLTLQEADGTERSTYKKVK
jgi:hypothetical protein